MGAMLNVPVAVNGTCPLMKCTPSTFVGLTETKSSKRPLLEEKKKLPPQPMKASHTRNARGNHQRRDSKPAMPRLRANLQSAGNKFILRPMTPCRAGGRGRGPCKSAALEIL